MLIVVRSARDRWLALRQELGKKLSARLFQELAQSPARLVPSRSTTYSWGVLLAYAGASLVYATSLSLGALGVWVLMRPWRAIFDPIIGVSFLLLCLASRPRVAAAPHYVLARGEYPMLHAVSDRIATAMNTEPVDGIAMSADFGANYRQAGWRGRRYIELGAPLLAVLADEERVAVIAHELSHGVNRDPLRSRFLYGALDTLVTWATAIRPMSVGRLGDRMAFGPFISLLAIPFELAMLAVSELAFLIVQGFMLLVLRQSQLAEYLADRVAASVAGSREMAAALEKTYLSDEVDASIRAHALTTPDEPIGNKMALAISEVGDDRLAALRAESLASQWQVDTTHPPTALRVELLRLTPLSKVTGLLSEEEAKALDSEVKRIVVACQREMVNRKLEAIYG